MGRQVEHRGTGYIHFVWTAQTGDTLGVNRGIGYQSFGFESCGYAVAPGGIRIESGYSGYATVDAAVGGWAIPVAHQLSEGTY